MGVLVLDMLDLDMDIPVLDMLDMVVVDLAMAVLAMLVLATMARGLLMLSQRLMLVCTMEDMDMVLVWDMLDLDMVIPAWICWIWWLWTRIRSWIWTYHLWLSTSAINLCKQKLKVIF